MKIYHIHFRKTGGTALRQLLNDSLIPSSPLEIYSDLEFFQKVPKERQIEAICASDFISGHFGQLGPLVPTEYVRICVLRDPLRRVVSGYNHMVADERDPLHAQIQGLDLGAAMDSRTFALERNRGKTRGDSVQVGWPRHRMRSGR